MSNLMKHPIFHLLRHAAVEGRPPSDQDLDELKLDATNRQRVLAAATEVAAMRARGQNGAARSHADEQAGVLLTDHLPEGQSDADYLAEPEDIPDDPQALAAQVSRRW